MPTEMICNSNEFGDVHLPELKFSPDVANKGDIKEFNEEIECKRSLMLSSDNLVESVALF